MLRIGIILGGQSREREVSFAGGRTVYDALDKSLFTPIALFVDGFGNVIQLDWQYIYKGTIRDFFPPAAFNPNSAHAFQSYSESLGAEKGHDPALLTSIGKPIAPHELAKTIDFAFLALHGPFGEDGSIQGMLDFYRIPYSGSGIFSSAIGISKAIQKTFMQKAGFRVNAFASFTRSAFEKDPENCFVQIQSLHFPVVVKASSQGSSIGVHFLHENQYEVFIQKVESALFKQRIKHDFWKALTQEQQIEKIRDITDLQHGLGLPLRINGQEYLTADDVLKAMEEQFKQHEELVLESPFAETEIVVEEMLYGKEFSCIVVRDENQKAIALPPTEIRKAQALFDYRAKYLPGITRKVTPIEIPDAHIARIRESCVALFELFRFNVYARIDGFVNDDGEVFLNDPNTTSGMMPSSFFFHQAAEIGLDPTQFLSYIIHQSLHERIATAFQPYAYKNTLSRLEDRLLLKEKKQDQQMRVGVIFGGISSERHISVESGRNVYEKLSSSGKYDVIPLYLTQDQNDDWALFHVPVNIMLKDNADDIRDKLAHFKIAPIIHDIIKEGETITARFADSHYDFYPKPIDLNALSQHIDFAFMALHGRPGEDGTLSAIFEDQGIPYNGSSPASAALTIDKFATNQKLAKAGILVAQHQLVSQDDWHQNPEEILNGLEQTFGYPLIAKPADDGCSSAVKKIKNRKELQHYADAVFRKDELLDAQLCEVLHLKANEEFPRKKVFMVEELIADNGADHFLEITGGLLTHFNDNGEPSFEMFEASEAVAESGILSLEEKFLAGEGQNLTPARYAKDPDINRQISSMVKEVLAKVAKVANIEGYCRIDAFVRIYHPLKVEVVVIEINSLPGLTPATAIFHQAAIAGYKPFEFLEKIMEYGIRKNNMASAKA